MLGKRGPQPGLFEADTLYGDFVGRTTFYGWLAAERGTLFRDEDFEALYCQTNGRPCVPPSLLATALILQTFDGVSDDEAKQRADYDLRWKVALGVELGERPFAKSTLQEFRAQLIVHEAAATLFQQSLELAKRRGKLRAVTGAARALTLALDTTNILGRGAVKDTYNLLADGIIQLGQALAEQTEQSWPEWAAAQALERYASGPSVKGPAEVDWSDAVERRAFLAEIVADADRLLKLARTTRAALDPTTDAAADATIAAAAGLLGRLLAQDIDRTPDGPALHQGTAPDRVVSVHDPEMRHGRKSASKRFDGHKAAIAVDTEAQLITAVAVLAGNAADHDQALALVEQSQARTGCAVNETHADCAYGDGGTRQVFAEADQTLVAKVPGDAQTGRFPKSAFTLAPEAQTCVCPAGHAASQRVAQRQGGAVYRFDPAVCGACPLRAQCVKGRGGRSIREHPQEALLVEARARQRSPQGRDDRARRQVVEHRLARLVQLGIRQARYLGRAKTLFQLVLAAAVANFTLLAYEDLAAATTTLARGGVPSASGLLLSLLVGLWAAGSALWESHGARAAIQMPAAESPIAAAPGPTPPHPSVNTLASRPRS